MGLDGLQCPVIIGSKILPKHFLCYFRTANLFPFQIDGSNETLIGREKGRCMTKSYEQSLKPAENKKKQRDNTKNAPKTSITQRLWTDLERSVGVTTAIQLVYTLSKFLDLP